MKYKCKTLQGRLPEMHYNTVPKGQPTAPLVGLDGVGVGWGRGLNLSLTCSVPVDMGDVTGCCLTGPHSLLCQHIVNVHKVVMGCHSQVPPFL